MQWSFDDLKEYIISSAPDGELRFLVDAIRDNTTDESVRALIDFWDDTVESAEGD